ncbi:MAG: alpha/beta fold hydrolase [Bacteroidota bacterium]
MELFYRKYGEPAPPMIILHGLYGSSDNWVSVAREFSSDYEVWLPDQRNHGASPASPEHSYSLLSSDLKEFMDSHGIEKAILIGHSMGGKAVMTFAARYPRMVSALVVIDIAPKDYQELALVSRQAAQHARMIEAMLSVPMDRMSSREEIDRFLTPLIGSDRVRMFLMKNVTRDTQGSFTWKINLPALKENLRTIMDIPEEIKKLPSGGITGFPVLFLAGGDSGYIMPEDHALIRHYFPTAGIVSIPGAGHWLHAEQPALMIKNIRYFLE